MKWSDTIANQCRYGEIAQRIWSDWDVIWEDSTADYQGHASFIANKGDQYCFYEWWYGSCSGCDGWEADGFTDEQVEEEMKTTALWLDTKEQMLTWLSMLEGNAPISNYNMERGGGLAAGIDLIGGGLVGRINAIREHFGMEKIQGNVED